MLKICNNEARFRDDAMWSSTLCARRSGRTCARTAGTCAFGSATQSHGERSRSTGRQRMHSTFNRDWIHSLQNVWKHCVITQSRSFWLQTWHLSLSCSHTRNKLSTNAALFAGAANLELPNLCFHARRARGRLLLQNRTRSPNGEMSTSLNCRHWTHRLLRGGELLARVDLLLLGLAELSERLHQRPLALLVLGFKLQAWRTRPQHGN